MSGSKKHSPQQSDNGSILSDIPDSQFAEFVDRLLARIPPAPVPATAPSAPKTTVSVERPETEEDGKRAGALRRLKASRGWKVPPTQTQD
jgi:hypothetical protein